MIHVTMPKLHDERKCASCGLYGQQDCPHHDAAKWWPARSCYVPPFLMTDSVEAGLQALANERADAPDWRTPLVEMLDSARDFVTSERSRYYGPPTESHQRIAALWNEWLTKGHTEPLDPTHAVTAADAAMMMLLLKVARLMQTPDHEDSISDIIGYALCYRDCVGGGDA